MDEFEEIIQDESQNQYEARLRGQNKEIVETLVKMVDKPTKTIKLFCNSCDKEFEVTEGQKGQRLCSHIIVKGE